MAVAEFDKNFIFQQLEDWSFVFSKSRDDLELAKDLRFFSEILRNLGEEIKKRLQEEKKNFLESIDYRVVTVFSEYCGSHQERGDGDIEFYIAIPKGEAFPEGFYLSHGSWDKFWEDFRNLPEGTLVSQDGGQEYVLLDEFIKENIEEDGDSD